MPGAAHSNNTSQMHGAQGTAARRGATNFTRFGGPGCGTDRLARPKRGVLKEVRVLALSCLGETPPAAEFEWRCETPVGGAGKTRFYCKPNLMQCNTSFVILDPKGEILRDTGRLLEKKDMRFESLTFISMEKEPLLQSLCLSAIG